MWISDYIASGLKRNHIFVDSKKIKKEIGLKWINNINEKKYETLSPFMDKFGF